MVIGEGLAGGMMLNFHASWALWEVVMEDNKQATTRCSGRGRADNFGLCHLVGAEGFEPSWLAPEVFKTSMYAIPSCPRTSAARPSPGSPQRRQKESIGQRTSWLAPILCPMLFIGGNSLGNMEATGGFEPPDRGFADPRLNLLATSPDRNGAEDGIRTRDLLLGKETRYHCATSARSLVPRVRIELTTPQFSVACSTD
jgi:hypothetical protein